MAKKIRKTNSKPNKKGTVKNPYTVEEFEQMLEDGQWKGGYVEEIAYTEGEGDNLNGDDYGYYGNDDEPDWEWELSEYTDVHYAGHPKYSGSVLANINGKDCTYLCLGELLSISSVAVSDLYAEWLIHCRNYTSNSADMRISYGLDGNDKEAFLNSILNKFNKELIIKKNGSEISGFVNGYLSGGESGRFIASIEVGTNSYHDVIVESISNAGYLIYHDPQNPSNSYPYTCGMVKNILQIKDKTND